MSFPVALVGGQLVWVVFCEDAFSIVLTVCEDCQTVFQDADEAMLDCQPGSFSIEPRSFIWLLGSHAPAFSLERTALVPHKLYQDTSIPREILDAQGPARTYSCLDDVKPQVLIALWRPQLAQFTSISGFCAGLSH